MFVYNCNLYNYSSSFFIKKNRCLETEPRSATADNCVFLSITRTLTLLIADGNTDGKFMCSTAVASAVLDWGSIRPWQHTFRSKLFVTLSCQQLNSAMLTFRNNVALTKELFTSKPPLKNMKRFLRYEFFVYHLVYHVFFLCKLVLRFGWHLISLKLTPGVFYLGVNFLLRTKSTDKWQYGTWSAVWYTELYVYYIVFGCK